MDEEENTSGTIAKADVVDALQDLENDNALTLLTDYYSELCGPDGTAEKRIENAIVCGEMLYEAKRYEEVLVWLDEIATMISDEEGPDSEIYMAFTEDEDLEALRMKASDRAVGDEEDEDDYEIEDE